MRSENTPVSPPRILYIKHILESYSDETHPLTLADITRLLKEHHGLTVHRITLTRDIDSLIAYGMDIIVTHSTQNRYFVGSRLFELPELRLLCDAIYSSKCLTADKSQRLTEKMLTLTSHHQAASLLERPLAKHITKPKNEQIHYIIDAINTAIDTHRIIRFCYTEYSVQKEKVLRGDGKEYLLSPYACIWNGDYYYVIGWHHERNTVAAFRVDRIAAVPQIDDEEAVPPPADFDLCQYTTSVFHMYQGEITTVSLQCKNDAIKTIIDHFGEEVHIEPLDEDSVVVTADVALSPTFFGWLFGFAGAIRLLSPQTAVEQYQAMLDKAQTSLPPI